MISLRRSHRQDAAAADAGDADDDGGGGGPCVMYAGVNGPPVTEHPSVGQSTSPFVRQAGPDASSLTPADRCGGGGRSAVLRVNSPFTVRPGPRRREVKRTYRSTGPPLHVVQRHA